MDPATAISDAIVAIGNSEWDEAQDCLDNYSDWRIKGGFAPTRGDSMWVALSLMVHHNIRI